MSPLRNFYDSPPWERTLISTLIRGKDCGLSETEFYTKEDHSIQVGFLCRKEGTKVASHQHLPVQKLVTGCQEVLIIKEGIIHVDVFSPHGEFSLLNTIVLMSGDIYIQYCGGHSFTFYEDTKFIEIKQGPYTPADKVFFNPLAHEQTK